MTPAAYSTGALAIPTLIASSSWLIPGGLRTQPVIALLTRWIDQCGVVPDALRQVIDRNVFEPARTATDIVTLSGLDSSAVNDYGFIYTEFHEIVTIDTTGGSLRLIVAADD